MVDTSARSRMVERFEKQVKEISKEISALRVELARARRAEGVVTSDEDERVWCEKEVQRHLADIETQRTYENLEPLEELEQEYLKSEVLLRVFGGVRFLAVWRSFDEATNMSVSGAGRCRIEHADGTIEKGPRVADSNKDLLDQVRQLASFGGIKETSWDINEPELELVTAEGDRLSAQAWSTEEVFVALRRPTLAGVVMEDLVGNGTMTPRCASALEAVVRARWRYLVSGEMNAGKTVTLRALASSMQRDAHLITVESQRELLLHRFPGLYPEWITALEARKANSEGRGEIKMSQLITSIQRMRPSYVLVGEIRGEETQAFVNALSQGYSCGATVHGKTSLEALYTLAQYFEQYTEGGRYEVGLRRFATFIDVVVHMAVHNGRRVVDSVRAIDGFEGGEVRSVELWSPRVEGCAVQTKPLPPNIDAVLKRHGFDSTLSDEDAYDQGAHSAGSNGARAEIETGVMKGAKQ